MLCGVFFFKEPITHILYIFTNVVELSCKRGGWWGGGGGG
jgi:hypothetical protein